MAAEKLRLNIEHLRALNIERIAERALKERQALGEVTCTSRRPIATIEPLGSEEPIATFIGPDALKNAQVFHSLLSYVPALAACSQEVVRLRAELASAQELLALRDLPAMERVAAYLSRHPEEAARPQNVLGERLGLRRETISRAFAALEVKRPERRERAVRR